MVCGCFSSLFVSAAWQCTGWKFEYVKCDWSNCFDKLENGEIDIMGDISYTDERAQKMLFPDEPMGEEKYILYADLSDMDIETSDFKSLDGKRVGVLLGTEPEIMLTEWENKNGIHTEHVNVNNDDDVEKKLANHDLRFCIHEHTYMFPIQRLEIRHSNIRIR